MNADDPIIDLQSDHYFMGEAIRQALKAYEAEEVPVGAVIVREGRIIARAFNQVELLRDATAHAEMLAITMAEERRDLDMIRFSFRMASTNRSQSWARTRKTGSPIDRVRLRNSWLVERQ